MDENMVKDVVCGMNIDSEKAAASVEHGGRHYYFCSEHCRDKFQASPDTYAKSESEDSGGHDSHSCC